MSQSAALAFILSQHAAEQDAIPLPTVTTHQAVAYEVIQPAPLKLDPWSFLVAMRNAGRRKNDNGRFYTDQSKVREDSIAAIHAYVGYDPEQLFGVQESAARTMAQREMGIKPPNPNMLTRAEQKAIHREAVGFVHGTPDTQAIHIENLLGRERLAASEMVRHEKESQDKGRSQEDRAISAGMVEFERERLMHVRADLIKIGVIAGNKAEG